MLDTGMIVQALERRGHKVTHMHKVTQDAGGYSFEIDGELYSLEQARELMEADDARKPPKAWRPRKPPVTQSQA